MCAALEFGAASFDSGEPMEEEMRERTYKHFRAMKAAAWGGSTTVTLAPMISVPLVASIMEYP